MIPLTIMLRTESATNSYKEGMPSLETTFQISFGMQISFKKKEGGNDGWEEGRRS